MLIPTDAWAALLESGVTVRPTKGQQVELVAAEGNAVAVTAVVERRPTALSPSHTSATTCTVRRRGGNCCWWSPRPVRQPGRGRRGRHLGLVADPTGSSAVTGRIVLSDRTIGQRRPARPDPGQPPSRPRKATVGRAHRRPPAAHRGPGHPGRPGTVSRGVPGRCPGAVGLVADGLVRRTVDAGRPRWAPADWDALVDWWLTNYPRPRRHHHLLVPDWRAFPSKARGAVAAERRRRAGRGVRRAADLLAPWRRRARPGCRLRRPVRPTRARRADRGRVDAVGCRGGHPRADRPGRPRRVAGAGRARPPPRPACRWPTPSSCSGT